MALQLTRRRFTVTEYYQMARAGILGEDDRVELIDGEIVQMAPIGEPHSGGVIRFTWLFTQRLGDVALVSAQNPIHLDDYNEPQPDIALLRPRPDFYASAHATPADILLLVEVAETSARLDRRVKVPLYARAGIQELWLADLGRDLLTVYRDPTPDGYRTSRTLRRGARIAPLAFPDRELLVADILGEAAPSSG
jgi:Uma2 family endonuclease